MPDDPCGPDVVAAVVREHRDESAEVCQEVARALDGARVRTAEYDEERGSLLLVTNVLTVRLSVSDARNAADLAAMVELGTTTLEVSGRSGSVVLTARSSSRCCTLRCFVASQPVG